MIDKKIQGIAVVMAKMTRGINPMLLQPLLNAATMASGNCPTFGGAD
jgi:hypothetical protein